MLFAVLLLLLCYFQSLCGECVHLCKKIPPTYGIWKRLTNNIEFDMMVNCGRLPIVDAASVSSCIESLYSCDGQNRRPRADSKMGSIPKGRRFWPQIWSVRSQIRHLTGVVAARENSIICSAELGTVSFALLLFCRKLWQKKTLSKDCFCSELNWGGAAAAVGKKRTARVQSDFPKERDYFLTSHGSMPVVLLRIRLSTRAPKLLKWKLDD